MKFQTMSQSSSRAQQNCSAVIYNSRRTVHNSYLAASNARAERVITDADLLINDVICKVVPSTGHRTDKHGNVMCLGQRGQVSR